MKLLNKGSELLQRQNAWWVGTVMNCQKCGQSVQLEYTDKESVKEKVVYIQEAQLQSVCPCCKGKITASVSFDQYKELTQTAKEITEEEFREEMGNML
jgi:predicted methyltransferase